MVLRVGVDWRPEDLARHLPASADGVWRGCRFSVLSEDEPVDWVVIHEAEHPLERPVLGDPANVAFVSLEPKESRPLRTGFYRQFTRIVATDPKMLRMSRVSRPAAGWWVGANFDYRDKAYRAPGESLGFDDLSGMPVPAKSDRVSIVTSTQDRFPGHAARNRLIAEVMRHPVGRFVDVHGGGRRVVPDKWGVIAPAKYHLALENTAIPNYWTEKLSDAFLGFALPLYFGCTNLEDYFPSESFVRVNVFRPRSVIATIERVLDERAWDDRLSAILEARRRILDVHHPLTILSSICDRPAQETRRFTLRPQSDFPISAPRRTAWMLKRAAYARTGRATVAGRPLWRLPP